jgi:hypothetical protein
MPAVELQIPGVHPAFKNERFLASGNPVRTGFDAVCNPFESVSKAF